MPKRIEVLFESQGKTLRAVVTPGSAVKGILMLGAEERGPFAMANGLDFSPAPQIPSGIDVMDGGTKVELTASDAGPGVCYWVGSELVCW